MRTTWYAAYRRRHHLILAAVAAVAMSLLSAGTALADPAHPAPTGDSTASAPAASAAPRSQATNPEYTNAPCNVPEKSRGNRQFAQCFVTVRTNVEHQIKADAAAPPASALGPSDVQQAYHLPSGGQAQTVAIVDAYGNSSAESDLAQFRSYYALPQCTSADGCFTKVDQTGGTHYPPDNASWGLETSLDLDAVSAACPKCHILLVQATDNDMDSLGAAVNTAVRLGAKYVSNSYGLLGESSVESSYDHYYDHAGVAVVAATGDSGNITNYPASSPNVTAVGGTTLNRDASVARGWTETAWSNGGSGCSPYEGRPDYQNGIATNCPNNKAIADISADADPNTGLGIFDSLGYGGWLQVGGTSLSAPLVTAMYALAGSPMPGTYPVTYPYQTASSNLFDITGGSNGSCGNVLCNAGPGWDGPTGLGSPNGVAGLALGPHGDIVGQVSDATTGQPLAGATISTADGYTATTDKQGRYDLNILTGSHDLTARMFAYESKTTTGVEVAPDQTTTADFSLVPSPEVTLSGVVTDGTSHGWPLYAKITLPGTSLQPVYTSPFTGRYAIQVPADATYTVHVEAQYPGYQPVDEQAAVGASNTVEDAALAVNLTACTAPGYAYVHGFVEPFEGWTGKTASNGWTVTDNLRNGDTWAFNNPGSRPAPPGGDSTFAIVDSGNYGRGGRQDTTLVSPSEDLSNQASPQLSFDTQYVTEKKQTASVDLSIDGGSKWSTIWSKTTTSASGHVVIPLPSAGGRPDVKVRFHFTGQFGWWWAVDNVVLGARSCQPVSGGLIAGTVTSTSGVALINATVASTAKPTEFGISATTPGDTAQPDGFYWLFSSLTGTRTFTATASGYSTSTATVDVAADQVTRRDWAMNQ
jgi:hypothetical protein